mgnify:CR=1 FL=1
MSDSVDSKVAHSGTLPAWEQGAEVAPLVVVQPVQTRAVPAGLATLEVGGLVGGRYVIERRVSEGSFGVGSAAQG